MKKIQGPNERKRVISCRGEDLSGSSPLGNKTSILQQPYHEKNRPASPKHPFLFENGKNPLPDFEKKHSHRVSSLRDSPKWTEITTYPGYHVHISCDDLRSTDLGNNLGKLQPCHALLWVSWHHAGTWRSNLDSWIDSRQVGGHCGYPPLTLVDAGPTTSHSL